MLTERYEESLQSLEKATELNPQNADAWNDKKLIQMKLNNVTEAINSSEKAGELDPSSKGFQENANIAAAEPGTVPERTIDFQ
jgi:Flp pilus assembly protein TadD